MQFYFFDIIFSITMNDIYRLQRFILFSFSINKFIDDSVKIGIFTSYTFYYKVSF